MLESQLYLIAWLKAIKPLLILQWSYRIVIIQYQTGLMTFTIIDTGAMLEEVVTAMKKRSMIK